MPFSTSKTLKKCRFCNKEVANLGLHVVNNHPSVMEQLEEKSPSPPPETPTLTPQITKNAGVSDINTLVREKLDIMLNIKLIEMLSQNQKTSLSDINAIINPPRQTTIQELKEYHDIVYKDQERELPETGNQWIDLATAGIPLIREMLNKKTEGNKDDEYRSNQEGNLRTIKPIQEQIATNRAESGSFGEESRNFSDTK